MTGMPKDSSDPEFTSLDCSAVIADVWLLLDGECDADAKARLQGHLEDCPSCFAHYGIEKQLKDLISRKCGGDAAPAGLRERLTLQIRRSVTVTTTEYRRIGPAGNDPGSNERP